MSGWTLGAGVEYALTSNISARLEYRHAGLGKMTAPIGGLAQEEISNKLDIFRTGVNYRF